jgi:hypothetical protein
MISVSTLPADGRTRSPLLSAQLTSPRTRAPKWSPGDCLTTEASSSRPAGQPEGGPRCTNRHVGASRHESLRADERIPPSTKLRSSGRAASRGGAQAASSPLAAGCPTRSPDDRRIDVDRLGSVGGWTPASDSRRFASSWLTRPCREVAVLKRTGRHQLGLRSVDLRTMATVRPPAPPCCVYYSIYVVQSF